METAVRAQGLGDLIAHCLSGSQEAWSALVERYAPLVWTVARSHRLSTPDCEEVFQLTWLRVYRSLPRLHTPERFPAWLTTCARRESLKQLERSGRYVPVGGAGTLDRPTAAEPGPEEHLLVRERRAHVHAALARLPDRDRRLLTLLSADPAPGYDEVSRRLGIARGSVGPLRGRALRRLAEQMRIIEGVGHPAAL
ncbi:sigma-70 family RNA polymerase sigma factor [Streptomyces sp. RY43-2]|uniref:Sigma-70 family RNA polymerase sigma factor n=1 Tax=Streptomyces macrolidinus TaxID=2952607 RepID=A0ABT0ZMN2_9ACTN|nr:sigma-70 family RNA polymerase sigma factor [Streptomyces macrolidinus]MCN9244844.1 sigma-70 family RNA polymerase sigma factor [Streptomyces macrolidinus]